MKVEEIKVLKNDFRITASPNPSAGSFELRVSAPNNQQPVLIRTIDMMGRVIDVKKIFAAQRIELGNEYKPGIFIIEALQENRRAVIKVMKIGD